MKLKNIIDKIESKYPVFLQYNWDNSGLNLGDKESDVKKILLTLEVTSKTVNEAIEKNVDLIISHHPFLFSKINKIVSDDVKGNLIYKLIQNNISVYCMHTSFDIAKDGLNDYFLSLIDIKESTILEVEGSNPYYNQGEEYGLGRVVNLDNKTSIKDICIQLKQKLSIKDLRIIGNIDAEINTLAVVTGAGAEFFELAAKKEIDLLITGDMKYHQAMDSIELGVNVIDCGHYGSEHIFADCMREFLYEAICMDDGEIKVYKSENIINPFLTF